MGKNNKTEVSNSNVMLANLSLNSANLKSLSFDRVLSLDLPEVTVGQGKVLH